MTESKCRPPFGVKVERFSLVGYHPLLHARPVTSKYPKIFPGCYDLNKPRNIVSKVPRWKIQSETEEFSRRLGYKNDRILKRVKWFKSINGPGWQDVPSFSLDGGGTFSKALSVKKFKSHAVPGPGTYGKHHVPSTGMEEKSKGKGFSFSSLPSFEQTSRAPRSLNTHISYRLPPTLYTLKNFTDEILSKRISKRGPYDLFSGERFPDPVVPKFTVLCPGLPDPSSLNHPKNAFKGVFRSSGRTSQVTSRLILTDLALAKKNPSDPGPSHYDPYPTPMVTQSVAPFNSSVKEVRPHIKCIFSAPPGRYNPELKRIIKGNGMKSAFLSKVKRSVSQPQKFSWFE